MISHSVCLLRNAESGGNADALTVGNYTSPFDRIILNDFPSSVHNLSPNWVNSNMHPLYVATGALRRRRYCPLDLRARSGTHITLSKVTIHFLLVASIRVSRHVPRPRTRTDIPETIPESSRCKYPHPHQH
jgi:hypothetical protein